MIQSIKKLLIAEIKCLLAKLERDEYDCTDEEAMRVISSIAHEAMSKEQVLVYLGWSRSKFDEYVSKGLMPKGRKRSGWKELAYYRDEINDALMNIRNKYGY